jgi:hypothetical protein
MWEYVLLEGEVAGLLARASVVPNILLYAFFDKRTLIGTDHFSTKNLIILVMYS